MTALAPGSSSAAALLNPVNPSIATTVAAPCIGTGGQPGFDDLLGAPPDHIQEPRWAAAVADGRQVQNNGKEFVSVGGVAPHVFIHAEDAHAVEPSRVVDKRTGLRSEQWCWRYPRTRLGPGRCAPPSHDERPAQ